MENVLQVEFKNVYGNELVYPRNGLALGFAKLLKVKSFNPEQIRDIKELGYKFELVSRQGVL